MNEHDVEDLLPHMRHVLSAERDLHEQTLTWSLIEASSAIGCPVRAESLLPTLSATRLRFGSLQRRLVGALARENIGALGDELGEAGQCTIDILVRNLFERTADVGFLATDAVLRDFCLLDAAARAGGRAALLARLREYRAKYSVYDDVIVLAPDGEVLARLDEDAPAGLRCTDPFVGQALARGGYVEYHGRSSLGADDAPALLYAHRIDSGRGGAAGVLVLRFRFADEMKRIFEGMAGARTEIALVLIDDQGNGTFMIPRPEMFAGIRDLDGARLEHALADVSHDVSYQHGVGLVVDLVASGKAAAGVLIRPVTVAEIQRTADEGLLMPPKSTFFTPKLRTGPVVRPLH
jgi:hypothetical protein